MLAPCAPAHDPCCRKNNPESTQYNKSFESGPINLLNLGPRYENACFYIDFKEMCVFVLIMKKTSSTGEVQMS